MVTGPDGEDVISIRSVCYLPLTYDHRLVDGADAGRFVTAIQRAPGGGRVRGGPGAVGRASTRARAPRVEQDRLVRVVLAGSSGLIGTALVSHLRAEGHEVLRLVRRQPAAPDERGWDPPAGRLDAGCARRRRCGGEPQRCRGRGPAVERGAPAGASATAATCPRTCSPAPSPSTGYAHWSASRPSVTTATAAGSRFDESAPSGRGFLAERHTRLGSRRPARPRRGRAGRASPHRPGAVPVRWAARAAQAGLPVRAGRPHRAGHAVITCRGSRSTTRSARSGSCWRTAPSTAR